MATVNITQKQNVGNERSDVPSTHHRPNTRQHASFDSIEQWRLDLDNESAYTTEPDFHGSQALVNHSGMVFPDTATPSLDAGNSAGVSSEVEVGGTPRSGLRRTDIPHAGHHVQHHVTQHICGAGNRQDDCSQQRDVTGTSFPCSSQSTGAHRMITIANLKTLRDQVGARHIARTPSRSFVSYVDRSEPIASHQPEDASHDLATVWAMTSCKRRILYSELEQQITSIGRTAMDNILNKALGGLSLTCAIMDKKGPPRIHLASDYDIVQTWWDARKKDDEEASLQDWTSDLAVTVGMLGGSSRIVVAILPGFENAEKVAEMDVEEVDHLIRQSALQLRFYALPFDKRLQLMTLEDQKVSCPSEIEEPVLLLVNQFSLIQLDSDFKVFDLDNEPDL